MADIPEHLIGENTSADVLHTKEGRLIYAIHRTMFILIAVFPKCDMDYPRIHICDPSHQNRAVVGKMHFKILLHLYGKKQRK